MTARDHCAPPILAVTLLFALTLAAPRPCGLVREWSIGDAYSWEMLDLYRDGTGYWVEGDRHGEMSHQDFRWRRDGNRLIVTSGSERRVVTYSIDQDRDGCTLHFDHSPVAHAGLEFYAAR
jgi:hypothetical protein